MQIRLLLIPLMLYNLITSSATAINEALTQEVMTSG